MDRFLQRHAASVTGVLQGWDRLRFGGMLPSFSYPEGVGKVLGCLGVRYKDFGRWSAGLSDRLKRHAEALAEREGREYRHLSSSAWSKEQVAREIIVRDRISEGLVCVLGCVESCRTISVKPDPKLKQLKLVRQERKCLHLYFYYLDREFGLMHVRLATWLPFGVQICINGREDLSRRMSRAGMTFAQRDNCFVRIDDLPRAQRMLEELNARRRVLRIETTINNPGRLRVYRPVNRQGRRVMCWAPMRKGVADIFRRAQVSQAANGRYLTALSVVNQPAPLSGVLDPISRRITRDARPYRALRPIAPDDARVFQILLEGRFQFRGITNRQLRDELLGPPPADPTQRRRQSAQTTRWLRLMRAHGLIGKVSRTRLYRVTEAGHRIMSTACITRDADAWRLAA